MKSARRIDLVLAAFACLWVLANGLVFAEDWPTYQHDNSRSGVTADPVKPPLREVWRYQSSEPPQPAWPDPAKKDYAAEGGRVLRPRTTYDRAFHVVSVGDKVYFGSSADDRIVALDTASGEERWAFFTGGPVRLAPTVAEGNLYAGSDDGYVYCLKAPDGGLVWKYSPSESHLQVASEANAVPKSNLGTRSGGESHWIAGNGRLISACPVRTGVVIKGDTVYAGAGLFPEEGVYLCALDARTGAEKWKTSPDPMDFIKRFSSQVASRRFALSPQGYLLASEQRLYVPTGRTSPATVDFATGAVDGLLDCPVGEGGTYALLSRDMIVSGPGTRLTAFDPNTRDQMATFPGRCILVRGEVSYLLSDNKIQALDRAKYREVASRRQALSVQHGKARKRLKSLKKSPGATQEQIDQAEKELTETGAALKGLEGNEYLWQAPCPESYAMILADDALFIGSDNVVTAFRASTGEQLWRADVQGKAYGLAAANGRLYVSTDKGVIHCFASGPASGPVSPTPGPRISDGHLSSPPTDTCAAAAQYIVDKTGITQGYCLDLGCGDGGLAYELARRTKLKVVAVDDAPEAVAKIRAALGKTGLYGARVAAVTMPTKKLPVTSYIANLIVSDRMLQTGEPVCSPEETVRLLRPYGGMVCLKYTESTALAVKNWAKTLADLGCTLVEDSGGWLIVRRGALPGAGEWSHQYADAANTTCSGDKLVHDPARLQWFGLPGPRPMIDRHHRVMPPLVKDGRLFITADDRVIAADAYNGTPLWEVEAPDSRRLASQRDSGQMVAADDWLYVAVRDECWALDAATGRRVATFCVPQQASGSSPLPRASLQGQRLAPRLASGRSELLEPANPDEKHNWGYIAQVGDLLFGSGQKVHAAYTTMNTLGDFEIQWGDFKRMVTSDYLFCMDRHTGKVLWTHQNGVVIHPTIAIGGGRMYFVESHSRKALEDKTGKIQLDELWADGPSLSPST